MNAAGINIMASLPVRHLQPELIHTINDKAASMGTTYVVLQGEVFAADNPGRRMFHCHVQLHAAMGMSAMIAYEGVTTPYSFGARSGNEPE